MYPVGLWVIALGFIILWLLVLTALILKQRHVLDRLFPGQDKGVQEAFEKALTVALQLREFKKESLSNIQRVYLKRYNPYQDTGGDMSFSVALLDGRGDGLVMTSLHSRSATRVFAKTIKRGKEDDHELSAEEKEVVDKALERV